MDIKDIVFDKAFYTLRELAAALEMPYTTTQSIFGKVAEKSAKGKLIVSKNMVRMTLSTYLRKKKLTGVYTLSKHFGEKKNVPV